MGTTAREQAFLSPPSIDHPEKKDLVHPSVRSPFPPSRHGQTGERAEGGGVGFSLAFTLPVPHCH